MNGIEQIKSVFKTAFSLMAVVKRKQGNIGKCPPDVGNAHLSRKTKKYDAD
jgi:hypothetical protein